MMLLQASLNRTPLSLSAAADLARRQPLTPARSPGQNPNDLGPSSTFAVDGGGSSFSLSNRPRHIGPDPQCDPLESRSMPTASGSSVSLGSGAHDYNQNRAIREFRSQTISDVSSAFKAIKALEAQMDAKINAKEKELEKAFAAKLDAEVKAKVEAALADRIQDIQKTHQLEKENVRRENGALRKKCARQQKKLEGIDAAGLAAHKAQPVENWMPSLPGEDYTVLMSTMSIMQDNAARLRQAYSVAGEQHSDAGEQESISEESTEGKGHSEKTGEDGQPAATVRKGCSGPKSYSNVAIDKVHYIVPGPNRKRKGGKGTTKDEGMLMGKLALFFTQSISVRTLCKAGIALAISAETVRAEYAPLAGHSTRRLARTAHPVDAIGRISRSVMTEAIHASLLALDYVARVENLIKDADVVSMHLDGSTFNDLAMTGLVLELSYICEDGKDDAGHQRHKVLRKTICCNSFVSADKKCVDVVGKDGSLMIKEVPFNVVLSLAMSGHLHSLLSHPCKTLGADKGSEAVGSGEGKKWAALRKAFLGRGGPLEQIFGTREAIADVQRSEYWPFLTKVMRFLKDPEADTIIQTRSLPQRLDTSGTMRTVPFQIRVVKRAWDAAQRKYSIISERLETVVSRETVTQHPFLYDAACKDLNCFVHYCDKHALMRAAVWYTQMFKPFLKGIMANATELRKINNHVPLKSHIGRILGIKGARMPEPCHQKARELLGEDQIKLYEQRFPNGLPRQETGVESRWLLIQKTVRDMDLRGRLIASAMPLALAEGTTENKIGATASVCSKEGFSDDGRIRFKSERVKACFLRLVSPQMILQAAVQSFTYTMAWQPLLSACAHRRECASSAVERMLRVVDYVLGRACKVQLPRLHHLKRERTRWDIFWRLCHRGLPDCRRKGETFLSTRLEKKPQGWKSQVPPALLHLYTQFYHPDMATAASRLLKVMQESCQMIGPILSDADRSAYSNYTAEKYGDGFGDHADLSSNFYARVYAAQWLFARDTERAVEAIRLKMAHLVSHPLTMLSKLYDFWQVELLPLGYEAPFAVDESMTAKGGSAKDVANDDAETLPGESLDKSRKRRTVDIATDEAILYAKLLHRQGRELIQMHGDQLHEFMTEPLKSLYQADMMSTLLEFSNAPQVNGKTPSRKKLYGRSTNQSREDLEGLGKVDPKSARASYPKPVTAFPALAHLALMACALTTNNNNVESRWSLLTYRYHAHVRHVTAEYMSAIFRQKDFETTNHLEYLGNENFGHIFAAAREFRRQNIHEYRNIYRPRQEEAEEREHRSSNPREKYAKLNTKETASTSTGSEKQRRMEKGKRARRHVGDQMTRRDTSDSDSDASRSSSDSEQASDCSVEEISEIDAAGQSDESDSSYDHDERDDGARAQSARAGKTVSSPVDDSAGCDSYQDQDALSRLSSKSRAGSQNKDSESESHAEDSTIRAQDATTIARHGESTEKSKFGSETSIPSRQGEALQQDLRSGSKSKDESSDAVQRLSGSKQLEAASGGADFMEDGHSEPKDKSSEDQNCGSSDECDVGSEFFDSDSESNTPHHQIKAAGAQGQEPNHVPNLVYPNAKELTAKQFKHKSEWKLSYIWYLLMHHDWKDTEVESNNGKILTLKRLDGAKFPLSSTDRLFYILYGDDGLEAINVEKIEFKVPASDELITRRRRSPEKQWCVTYTRALCTELALRECKSDSDFHSTVTPGSGTGRNSSLGADSLRKCLRQQNEFKLQRTVFHRGDFPRETKAQYIVGFIAWDSLPCGPLGCRLAGNSTEVEKDLLKTVKEKLTLRSTGESLIKRLDEIDWVYLAQDFSDQGMV